MHKTSSIHVGMVGLILQGMGWGCRDVDFDLDVYNTAEAVMPTNMGTRLGQYFCRSSMGEGRQPLSSQLLHLWRKGKGENNTGFKESLQGFRGQRSQDMNNASTKKQNKNNNNLPQRTANPQETLGTKGCILGAHGDCSDWGDTSLSLTNSKLSLPVFFFFLKVFITFLKDKIKSRSNWKKRQRPPNILLIWQQCSWFTVGWQFFCSW